MAPVRRAARASDDGLEAARFGAGRVVVEQIRRAVRGHHPGFEVNA
jgi:hypothetical protein